MEKIALMSWSLSSKVPATESRPHVYAWQHRKRCAQLISCLSWWLRPVIQNRRTTAQELQVKTPRYSLEYPQKTHRSIESAILQKTSPYISCSTRTLSIAQRDLSVCTKSCGVLAQSLQRGSLDTRNTASNTARPSKQRIWHSNAVKH